MGVVFDILMLQDENRPPAPRQKLSALHLGSHLPRTRTREGRFASLGRPPPRWLGATSLSKFPLSQTLRLPHIM